MKHVMLLTGAGQIGMAIARRMGYGMKIVMGDKTLENAQAIAKTMNDAGFDVIAMETDISSQSGWRIPALTPAEDEALACTPTEELLGLDFLQRSKIRDTLHAYQLAKRCNEKRVMAESVKWGARGARLNANAAELLISERGAFITGSTLLIDGGATASYYYGPLKPQA